MYETNRNNTTTGAATAEGHCAAGTRTWRTANSPPDRERNDCRNGLHVGSQLNGCQLMLLNSIRLNRFGIERNMWTCPIIFQRMRKRWGKRYVDALVIRGNKQVCCDLI